jgi:signal recognition particle subunit SRP54
MGDVLSLIEQAEKAFDADQAADMASKFMSGGELTLEDFIQQLAMLRKLGPIQNLLGMMPGAAKNKELLSQVNEKDLDRAEAIVRSMTPAERQNPKIINGSRRLRIANGSGTKVGDVSQLVTNFFEGQKQMKMLLGGGMPGMPGMPGMAGGRKGARAQKAIKAQKKKAKRPGGDPRKAGAPRTGSGNPAAADQAQAQQPQVESMEDLQKMLEEAQAAGGPAGFGEGGGFPGMGGPGSIPPGFGGRPGAVPPAFGKKRKKK